MNKPFIKLGAIALVLALPLTAGAAVPRHSAKARPQLYHITIGVKTPFQSVSVNNFAPDQLTIHAGDSVQWTNLNGNQPQTVTFGPTENTPSLILSLTYDEVNPRVVQPQGGHVIGDTSLNVYSSGALMSGMRGLSTSYTFTFPNPGTFVYRSLFHPLTQGTITVVPAGKPVSPNPPDRGASLSTAIGDLSRIINIGTAASGDTANPNLSSTKILVGYSDGVDNTVSVDAFAPYAISVPYGTKITWITNETSGDIHDLVISDNGADPTAANGVPLYTGRSSDGGLTLNPSYIRHTLISGSTVTTTTLQAIDQISRGVWQSGLIYGSSPAYASTPPISYTLTFQAPGRFSVVDPFHLGMDGIINVVAPPGQ